MGSCMSSDGGGGSRSSLAPSSPGPGSTGVGSKKGNRVGRKRQGSLRHSSFEAIDGEDQIHRIPGRMFLNGASKEASLFTQQGKKGTNQDAMVVWENFGSRTDTVFCGVFDGHGPFGHLVARRVRDCLPLKLRANWDMNLGGDELRRNSISTTGSLTSEETTSIFLDDELKASSDFEEEKLPEVFTTLKESFLKAFKVMDKELKLHPNIDCFCSGTTAVTLLKQGQDLVIGNVGDSRAVLGTRDHNDSLVAVQLTVDLKPNLPREAERIKRYRGRVFALRDEPEVARVWLPNYDSPGLAMARAFGDFCLKDFGLISVPEISYHRITEKDEFIVLATDGIWDVLSNKEVVDIVASAAARSSAARSLVEHAVRAWRLKYPTSKVDDCAVVCLFLDTDDPTLKESSTEALSTDIDKQNPSTLNSSSAIFPGEEISSSSPEKLPDGNSAAMDTDDWSALEGVTRSNTLLTLPRFAEGEKQLSARNKAKK
ncbi:hypothetical protein IEQ34_021770 [Dendrobium chrysotoxum]|uniref:protein-serine/threonine phosphatase n=1 Tax=Dendrobium chrysotoxum TaxID=161865 RepID=A0AAV7G5M7_DENCH|nr:hypothetical protein IEQ34_021770 [Dendrobium chrysotoxum]